MLLHVWSIGCIFGEILNGMPIFGGQDICSEIQVLYNIFKLLGTPDRIPWSGGLTLKDDDLKFPQFKPKSLLTAFPGQSEATLDLLKKCLIWDPIYRISAKGGLEHRYFHVNTEKKT
eukprot:TRINITY_DN2278_c0_g1_i13.p1 TRINITY_DN2278_c0_g1~~TRINITY_DN2278_c0_g1_i13.p1  ORF type:complete len:117 (+),score=28.62 TRINITY_DN2278_c0_g1_i13:336-686(+)